MRRAGWILAILMMAGLSLGGLYNATNELPDAETSLQQSVGFFQLLYGFLGVFGTVGFIRRRPWVVTVTVAWGLAATLTASIASFAFHDPTFSQPGTWAGVAGSGASCLLLTALMTWAARVAVRPLSASPAPPA